MESAKEDRLPFNRPRWKVYLEANGDSETVDENLLVSFLNG